MQRESQAKIVRSASSDRDLVLHSRLIDGDSTVGSEIVEAHLLRLVRYLASLQLPGSNDDAIGDAAIDAILDYLEAPDTFRPERRGLHGYLKMSALGNLRNTLAKLGRRNSREVSLASVELGQSGRKRDLEALVLETPESVLCLENAEIEALQARLANELDGPHDAAILLLMLSGERQTARFADALGISSLSVEEQRRIVKQHKDRIKKRAIRLGCKLA